MSDTELWNIFNELKNVLDEDDDKNLDDCVDSVKSNVKNLDNNETLGIQVPIGLNVEHIMSYNFQTSINMLQELSKIYREFCIKTSLYD